MQNDRDKDRDRDRLDQEIKAARQEFEEDYNPPPKESTGSEGANIGYEFLAYVISGGILGYVADKFLDTIPFGMMIGIIFGFVGGVIRANKRTKDLYDEKDKKNP